MPVLLPKGTGDKPKRRRTMAPVRPNRSVRKRYTDLLVREVDLLKAQTANLSDILRSDASRARVAERLEQLSMQSIERMRVVAPRAAKAFVDDADKAQKKQLENNISRALGTDFATILDTPSTAADIDLAVSWNSSLIKSIPSKHWDLVGQAVLDNYRGAPLPDGQTLTQRLMQIGGISENRARFIARDQTAKLTSALNKSRQSSNGIESYTWQNSGDARVVGNPAGKYPKPTDGHGDHWDREGKTFSWDRPPSDGHPGEAYNCFPGSTKLTIPNGCHKLWRHQFSGRLATLVTVGGVRLEATPNHPILTRRGWVAAGDVQQGDDLIQAVRYGGFVHQKDVDNSHTTFEQLFDFARLTRDCRTVGRAEFDFHGERPQNDVDVVEIDADLLTRLESLRLQFGEQFNLTAAPIDLAGSGLDTTGTRQMRDGQRASGVCGPGLSGDDLAFVGGQFSEPNKIGFGAGSKGDRVRTQNPGNDSAGHPVTATEFKNAQTVKVSGQNLFVIQRGDSIYCWSSGPTIGGDTASAEGLAQVVRMYPDADRYVFEGEAVVYQPLRVIDKGFREFQGHVFNLQTEPGWYGIDSGIVVHNCRCVALPVLDLDKLDAMYP